MKINVTCSHCSKEFGRDHWKPMTGNMFCSRECLNTGKNRRKPTTLVTFNCDSCGSECTQPRCQYNSTTNHFCNARCKGDWQVENLKGSSNPSYSGAAKLIPCCMCGKESKKSALQQKINGNSFCGHKCYGEWRKGKFAGPESPSWITGKKYYRGPNWKAQSLACRTRDGMKCKSCGKAKYIHAHHIVPFRMFGYDREKGGDEYLIANRLENLITLCASCHGKAEKGSLCLIRPPQ